MGGKGSGRPRKFKLGDIARVWSRPERYVAVVNYKTTRTFREYRVVPLDRKLRRAGRAYWIRSAQLEYVGTKSKDSVKTYLINERLEERHCECQCCVHEAIDLSDFNRWGDWDPVP